MNAPELPELDPPLEALFEAARQEPPVPVAPTRRDRLRRRIERSTGSARAPTASVRFALGVALAAAAAVLVVMLLGPAQQVEGRFEAAERSTVALGARATAVLEPSARVAWIASVGGRVSVRQVRGVAVYRVDSGGAFEVQTGAGTVSVLGTTFEVEVETMEKPKLRSMAVGAAVATAVVVTVYEGKVVLANDHGAVEIPAGERARAQQGAPPSQPVPRRDAGSGDALHTSWVDSVSQNSDPGLVRRLRDRVRELEEQLETAGATSADATADNERNMLDVMWEPTQDELEAAAASCEVTYAWPSTKRDDPDAFGLSDKHAKAHSVTPDERKSMVEFATDANEKLDRTIRALYVEATGDDVGAATLSTDAMRREIISKGHDVDARRQVARERAGLEPAPAADADEPPLVRMYRYHVQVTDAFNQAVLDTFGPDRGREVRKRLAVSMWHAGSCDPDPQ